MDYRIILINIFIIILCFKYAGKKRTLNKEIEKSNKLLEEENKELDNIKNSLSNNIKELETTRDSKTKEINKLDEQILKEVEKMKNIQITNKSTLENQQKLSEDAFRNYFEILENKYKETESEYEDSLELLKNSYFDIQMGLMKSYENKREELADLLLEAEEELAKMKKTRDAQIEAARREKEIKEQSTFYCLQISDDNKADIKRLSDLRKTFNHPRVISKLIWSDFIQKDFKALGIKILGTSNTVCGIYKITSLITGECYIGQSVGVLDRWLQHGKAGCGIDTPAANKLYKAMIEDGIWNFSWELLEECPREQLDEKEKYYINLYDSCSKGYNSTCGNH